MERGCRERADVFTKEEHFRLDYTQPAGREAGYAGFTTDEKSIGGCALHILVRRSVGAADRGATHPLL